MLEELPLVAAQLTHQQAGDHFGPPPYAKLGKGIAQVELKRLAADLCVRQPLGAAEATCASRRLSPCCHATRSTAASCRVSCAPARESEAHRLTPSQHLGWLIDAVERRRGRRQPVARDLLPLDALLLLKPG